MSSASTAPRLTPDEIRQRIAKLPRIPFAFTPTPLEDCPRLSKHLGGPRILIKRDDLTGFAFGGNKVRALEFRMADAKAKGCDAFVLVNIGQSNHARLHSAACTRLGMKMVIVKPGRVDEPVQGNLLLDKMLGVEIVATGTTDAAELEKALDDTLADLRRRGYTPYASTRDPFSPLAGTIAFTEASIELQDQLAAANLRADHIFLVGGSTAAGLALGGKLLGAPYHVHPCSVGGSGGLLSRELKLANGAAAVLDLPPIVGEEDFTCHEELGHIYGVATPETLDAIRTVARTESIFLDPVYTGKAMAALIDQIQRGNVGKDETVVFVHTGGLPIIFAYHEILGNL